MKQYLAGLAIAIALAAGGAYVFTGGEIPIDLPFLRKNQTPESTVRAAIKFEVWANSNNRSAESHLYSAELNHALSTRGPEFVRETSDLVLGNEPVEIVDTNPLLLASPRRVAVLTKAKYRAQVWTVEEYKPDHWRVVDYQEGCYCMAVDINGRPGCQNCGGDGMISVVYD